MNLSIKKIPWHDTMIDIVDHDRDGGEGEPLIVARVWDEPTARVMAAAPDLLAAAKEVLAGLLSRIAQADPGSVPLFEGISDLYDAIGKADDSARIDLNALATERTRA